MATITSALRPHGWLAGRVGTLVANAGGLTLWKANFKGSLTGNLLEGTLEGGGFGSSYAKGTLSGTTLGISVWDADASDRGGQIYPASIGPRCGR